MGTKVNLYKQSNKDDGTRVNFNVPRSLTYGLNARANDDGGVSEADNCEYNILNSLFGISYEPLPIQPETAAYLAATGITGATEVNAINTMVYNLKQYGLWSKMKAVYPFVTDNRNLLSYTEDFSNAYWDKDPLVSVTTNSTTAPNGTLTADTITLPADASSSIYKQLTVSISTTYTVSFYIKATSGQAGNTVCFRTNPGLTTNMITLTNDWVRYSVVVSPTSTPWSLEWGRKNSATATSFFLWGAQLELGSTATTYQPILGSQQAYISNQFKYNLVNPVDSDAAFRLVFSGGWTHSANGATPNGTNGYADTKLNWNSNTSLNDVSFGCYWRNNIQTITGSYYGVAGGGAYVLMRDQVSCDFYVNDNGTGTIATLSKGLHLATRKNSTQQTLYVNGSGTAQSRASLSKPNVNFYFGGSNGFTSYTNNQMALALISDGLNDTEAAYLYSITQQYQTFLNRAV